jgi:hypothetical protein
MELRCYRSCFSKILLRAEAFIAQRFSDEDTKDDTVQNQLHLLLTGWVISSIT